MQRDSYFDNFKGLLIILVLIGHFINPLVDHNHLANFLKTAIFTFHMPAFIFISAYFSKKNPLIKLVKTLILPYIIFQFIYFLFGNLAWGKGIAFQLFYPDFTLWFLMSLFWWRILIDKIIRIKKLLPILILLGILIGFDTSIGTFASLERTIAFFPFFLLGYQFDRNKFMKFADKKIVQIVSVFLLSAIFVFLYIECDHITYELLTMQYSYKKIGLPEWGWLQRTFLYALSSLIIYLLAIIIPRNRHWFSYLGQRTLSIYLIHGLIYKSLKYMTDVYDILDNNLGVILTVLFSVVLTFILSIKPFDLYIKKIYKISLEKLSASERTNSI